MLKIIYWIIAIICFMYLWLTTANDYEFVNQLKEFYETLITGLHVKFSSVLVLVQLACLGMAIIWPIGLLMIIVLITSNEEESE